VAVNVVVYGAVPEFAEFSVKLWQIGATFVVAMGDVAGAAVGLAVGKAVGDAEADVTIIATLGFEQLVCPVIQILEDTVHVPALAGAVQVLLAFVGSSICPQVDDHW
jgi:hypothetical protein